MASIINTGTFAKALWPGVNKWYGQAYGEFKTEYTELFESNTSRRRWEEDVGTSGFGLASVKPEGESISYDGIVQGFTTRYPHIVYATGFMITREMVEDDLYDVVGKKNATALAFSMRQTKEIVGANVYNRAFTAGYTGGDGVILCSSAHPTVGGVPYSNVPTVAADLSEASLEQAVIDISKYTNDRNMRIAVRPRKLIIPVDLMFEAERILKSPGRVATANNDLNALGNLGMFENVVVNHYLTDTDAWFIRTDVMDGMKYWSRRGMEFAIDNDFDTENAKFKATERYSFGWTDPRGIYGSAGA